MSYTTKYTNEDGVTTDVTITDEDSTEALKNDYSEIMRSYNQEYVSIERVSPNSGEALHLRITVKAPSHYLTSSEDVTPKACDSMAVDVVGYHGYPITPLKASYQKDHFLASPNVFRSGQACIDAWVPFKCSLTTTVEKLVRDMIHDPCVTRYDSVANRNVVSWHKKGVESGQFPTISPRLLFASEAIALPPRRSNCTNYNAVPALPKRRH